MKLAAISDMHGNLSFKIDKCNILLICGDIMPLSIQFYHKESRRWFKKIFIPWCQAKPVEEIFLVGGNHDKWLYDHPEEVAEDLKGTNIHYLLDESSQYTDENGIIYNIYGTPWCHQFGNWSFMGYSDDKLKEIFSKMPEHIDILITHSPPYGHNDIASESIYDSTSHLGNKALSEVIRDKSPKFVFSGHIHTGEHDFTTLGESQICNVSMVNERYDLNYPPKYVEFEKTV